MQVNWSGWLTFCCKTNLHWWSFMDNCRSTLKLTHPPLWQKCKSFVHGGSFARLWHTHFITMHEKSLFHDKIPPPFNPKNSLKSNFSISRERRGGLPPRQLSCYMLLPYTCSYALAQSLAPSQLMPASPQSAVDETQMQYSCASIFECSIIHGSICNSEQK